ncbi:SRPBCC family protein [Weeksellaceae bacterium TAE3-ERU29]|nr:SRPBCC family protein [Weeksellaceae bacterium TAE3-ERU29]
MNKITLEYHSGIYQLKSKQIIQASLDEVWDYFSKPQNLNSLTPKDMAFEITSGEPSRMYEGQIISYQIEILPIIKSSWVTEITHVKEGKMFVDEQRFGPYVMWHHEHHFKVLSEHQVVMNDIVSYKLPLGRLGRLVAGKIIGNRVRKIFEFREEAVDSIFRNK